MHFDHILTCDLSLLQEFLLEVWDFLSCLPQTGWFDNKVCLDLSKPSESSSNASRLPSGWFYWESIIPCEFQHHCTCPMCWFSFCHSLLLRAI